MVLFKPRVTTDVNDRCPGAHERRRHEKTSMAARRIFLSAEDRRQPILRKHDEPYDPIHEVEGPRAAIVVDGPVVPIELTTLRATSELASQEDIVDTGGSEPAR